MLLANKRLPYGNQIWSRIMSLLKSILGKRKFLSTSMFRWRFLKKIFNVLFLWWRTASCSLRADEIKLWLTPSAKQRRNPCSGLPAVYPDLSTRHDWPVKKGLCFVCRDRQSGWRGIRNALPVIRWVRWGVQNKDLCAASQTVLIRV